MRTSTLTNTLQPVVGPDGEPVERGRITAMVLFNPGASRAFFHTYEKTGAEDPVLGQDTPSRSFPLEPGERFPYVPSEPISFHRPMWLAATATNDADDPPASPLLANVELAPQ